MKSKILFTLFVLAGFSFAQSKFNYALKLNGVNQCLEIPHMNELNIGEGRDFTFEFMFKADSLKPAVLYAKVDFDQFNKFNQGIVIDVFKVSYKDDYINYSSKFPDIFMGYYFPNFMRVLDTGFRGGTSFASSKVTDWNNYMFSQGNNKSVLDIMNGLVVRSGTTNLVKNECLSSLYIGGYPNLSLVDTKSIYFAGLIDEIKIWNKLRTQQEVLLYNNDTLSVKNYTSSSDGLVGYYRFDKIEKLTLKDGTTYDYCIRDLSFNQNHAKIINGATLVNHDINTSISFEDNVFVTDYVLYQNYPNPFNPATIIKYSLPKESFVNLVIYDALGRKIATLINNLQSSGNYQVEFNSRDLSSGTYFYQLNYENHSLTKKMQIIK